MTTPAEPVPEAVAAAWRASEAQLYGSLVWDPDLYQRVVTLVGQVVERLRRLGPSSEELRRAARSPGELQGDLLNPYRRLEVEVATGRALCVTTVADDSFTAMVHEVSGLQVNLADGRFCDVAADDVQAGAAPSRHEDWVARERQADRLRGGARPR